MTLPSLFSVLLFTTALYMSNSILSTYTSNFLNQKTMERRYFQGSRNPKNYCIQISVNNDNIEVIDTYKNIYKAKFTEFIDAIKKLEGNQNKDAEYFKNVLLEALNEKEGYVNIWYEQNTKSIDLHNNKIVPSHKFYFKDGLILNDNVLESIQKVYQNIISLEDTNEKNIKSITYLAFNGFLTEILIVVLNNVIIGYKKGQVFFEIHYELEKVIKNLEDIEMVKRFKIFVEHAFVILVKENTIILKAMKKNNEVRAIIEMDKDVLGYESFLNLTYGKKVPKNIVEIITKVYIEDKKLTDLEIEEANNIYHDVKEAFDSRNTRFTSFIHM